MNNAQQQPSEQELTSIYAHGDLTASLDELSTMDPDWVDLDTLLDAQDKLAVIISKKQGEAV